MTSRCSRSSQPNYAATIRCSGSTSAVYDTATSLQFSDTSRAGPAEQAAAELKLPDKYKNYRLDGAKVAIERIFNELR
jgi:hypothetical protein